MRRTLAAIALVLAFAAPASSPAATGANGRIFFGSNRDGNDEVYSAAPDGSDAKDLTQNAAADFSPAVSPDGSRVAFVSDRSGRRSLWLMNADGSGQTQLTDGFYLAPDDEPSWSPDGTQLAFASTRPFNDGWHVWAVNADGTNLRQLTAGFGVSPSWSPDGTQIAYDGGGAVWLMNADGSGAHQLTPGATPESAPAWSPDGTQLVFGRYRADWQTSNVHNLWVVRADGSGERQLTVAGTYDGKASWSPDGTQIVFQRHFLPPFGGTGLYAVRADGSFLYALSGGGDNYQPAWSVATGTQPPPAKDITPPTITLRRPSGLTDRMDVFTLGQSVTADYECADAESGVRHCVGSVAAGAPLDTSAVGTFEFRVSAADQAGNATSKGAWYRVVYPFAGFAAPVANGALTDLRAGDSAPLKFSLGADYGLDVVSDAAQQQVDCASMAPLGAPSAAGGTLTYNGSRTRYLYEWDSAKSSAGTCRSVTLTLRDGTRHEADFRLQK